MVKTYLKKNLIAYVVGIFVAALLLYLFFPWVILPTSSSPHMLTLVKDGYPRPRQIVMRYYIDNKCSNEYVLNLKNGLYNHKPQKYTLPRVNEGMVEINIELEDGVIHDNSKTITIRYDNVKELYNKGLLIYLTTDYMSSTYIGDFVYYDQYVSLVSGDNKIYYLEKAGSSEWFVTNKAPKFRKIVRKVMGYVPFYHEGKENKWVLTSVE